MKFGQKTNQYIYEQKNMKNVEKIKNKPTVQIVSAAKSRFFVSMYTPAHASLSMVQSAALQQDQK